MTTAADTPGPDAAREGIVVRAAAGSCEVAEGGRLWRCDLRGRLKKGPRQEQTPAVAGDRVRFTAQDAGAEPPTGVVDAVLPRRSRVSRRAARRSGGHIEQVLMANLDQVVAVQSLRAPAPQTGFVDRLLVAAERFGVDGVLVLNKIDLAGPGDEPDRWDYYRNLDVTVLRTSAATGEGLEAVRAMLAGKVSLLLGASGVGKSSLLNAVEPGLGLRVGHITDRTGLGRHTTTSTELFPVADAAGSPTRRACGASTPGTLIRRCCGTIFPTSPNRRPRAVSAPACTGTSPAAA